MVRNVLHHVLTLLLNLGKKEPLIINAKRVFRHAIHARVLQAAQAVCLDFFTNLRQTHAHHHVILISGKIQLINYVYYAQVHALVVVEAELFVHLV